MRAMRVVGKESYGRGGVVAGDAVFMRNLVGLLAEVGPILQQFNTVA